MFRMTQYLRWSDFYHNRGGFNNNGNHEQGNTCCEKSPLMERNPKTETNPFLPQNLSDGDGGAKIYRLRLLLASSIDRRQQALIPGGTIIARINVCGDR